MIDWHRSACFDKYVKEDPSAEVDRVLGAVEEGAPVGLRRHGLEAVVPLPKISDCPWPCSSKVITMILARSRVFE
jgi:hypothetical protein